MKQGMAGLSSITQAAAQALHRLHHRIRRIGHLTLLVGRETHHPPGCMGFVHFAPSPSRWRAKILLLLAQSYILHCPFSFFCPRYGRLRNQPELVVSTRQEVIQPLRFCTAHDPCQYEVEAPSWWLVRFAKLVADQAFVLHG